MSKSSMSKSSVLGFVTLFFGMAALTPACSTEDKYFLLVDISLHSSLVRPDSVTLAATQNGLTLKQSTVTWPAADPGTFEVGLGLPSDTTGTVMITGVALRVGQPVGQGSVTATGILKGQNNGPFKLLIQPLVPSGDDGGTGGSALDGGIDGAGGTGGSPSLDGAPDSGNGGQDGAPFMDGTQDVPAADAAEETAQDAPSDVGDSSSEALPVDTSGAETSGPRWSVPRAVDNDPDKYCIGAPAVAVSPTTGDVVVVWTDYYTGVRAIHYSAATDTWDAAPITLDARDETRYVQLGVDDNGHFIAVWAHFSSYAPIQERGIWASYSSDGVNWSKAPVLLAAGPSNAWYEEIRLAMNGAGQAWVVWDQTVTPSSGYDNPESVYAAYLSGTMAKPAVLVKAGTQVSGERHPRVAIDGKGNGLVVWGEVDSNPAVGNASTWAAALVDGTPPVPALIESYDDDRTFGSDVAMNADGQGVAVWVQSTRTTDDVVARRYSVTAGWETPQPQPLIRVRGAGLLSADVDRYGTVNIGWAQRVGGAMQATFSTQPVGGAWTSVQQETDNLATTKYTDTDIEAQVRSALNSGSVLMSWSKQVADGTYAVHLRWRKNGAWEPDVELGRIDNLHAFGGVTSVAPDGRAVVAWNYYHCEYDSLYPDKCPNIPFSSLPPSTRAASSSIFVSVYK